MRLREWPIYPLLVMILMGVCLNMPHGYPPWSGITKKTVFSIPIDLGELAARMGSVVTNDRRGDVVWIESFDSGLEGWISAFVGTDGGVVQSAKAYRTGPYSAEFTTGKNAAGNASLSKYHPRLVLGKTGLEVSFAAVGADPTVRLRFYHYDGAEYHLFSVRYDYPNEKFQYLDNATAWQTLDTGVAFYPNITSFNFIKLVVDLENGEYERAILNDSEHSLAGIDALSVASVTAPYLSTVLFADGDNDDNYLVYFDDVIITQNEP